MDKRSESKPVFHSVQFHGTEEEGTKKLYTSENGTWRELVNAYHEKTVNPLTSEIRLLNEGTDHKGWVNVTA